jgi:ABC-2 type transport system ATP-binding protein
MTTTSTQPLAIETHGLAKSYGEVKAVAGVDLVVPRGMVYGFLGPNGAGKTTTIRMLATLVLPDGGTAKVFGHDLVAEADAVRARIGLTGQFASIDEDLTGIENLVLLGRLLGFSRAAAKKRAADLLAAFDLAEAGSRLAKTYSGGMRRRLDIAASLVVPPDLLFLDEPTTGLDPRSRNQVWDIIRALASGGTTVLLTTQYLEEADQLADRIAVIDHGRVIAEGTPRELKASIGLSTLKVRLQDVARRNDAERILQQALGGLLPENDPAGLSARVSDPGKAAEVLAALTHAGITLADFSLAQPSLDEVFLTLTGHPASESAANERGQKESA